MDTNSPTKTARNHTKHFVKVGTVYATRDLRFRIRKSSAGTYWLVDTTKAKYVSRTHLAYTKGDALRIADEIVSAMIAREVTA